MHSLLIVSRNFIMHYRNGREAKNGDPVMLVPKHGNGVPVVGILYMVLVRTRRRSCRRSRRLFRFNAQAGNDQCNGQPALMRPGDPCPNLAECLHLEDAKAALAEEISEDAPKKTEYLYSIKAEIAAAAAALEPLFGATVEQSKIITDVTQKLWQLSAV